jgi:hypothetical protein
MSMSNLMWMNINFMDMKRHMLINLLSITLVVFISMLVDKEKEWGSYKMEVVIRKGKR